MIMKAQIQFTRLQLEPLSELQRQTGATHTELFRRAVVKYIHEIRELSLQAGLQPSPTSESREGPRSLRANPSVTATHFPTQKNEGCVPTHSFR